MVWLIKIKSLKTSEWIFIMILFHTFDGIVVYLCLDVITRNARFLYQSLASSLKGPSVKLVRGVITAYYENCWDRINMIQESS